MPEEQLAAGPIDRRLQPVLLVLSRSALAAGEPTQDLLESIRAGGYLPRLLRGLTESQILAAAGSASEACRLIFVMGGDGSVNHVVNALEKRPLPLVILPAGTANDLASELGSSTDVQKALARIRRDDFKRIDLVQVNGRLFCSTGGLGLPAESAMWINRLRCMRLVSRLLDLLGPRVYRLSAFFRIFLGNQGFAVQIRYLNREGKWQRLARKTAGILVANQGMLAAGLCFSPASRNDDGVFELAILPSHSRARLLGILVRLSRGLRLESGEVPIVEAAEAVVECERNQTFFGDGEFLATGRRFHLTIRPRVLQVL